MEKGAKIYVAGHRGLVGSAIVRALQKAKYENLVLKTRQEVDLLNQQTVADFFVTEKPEYVFLSAAKVGGILANKEHPAEFIYQNLQIQNNIIESARQSGVKKLIFLGSSCIYPKLAPQPIKEEYLLTGPLEETNKAYALAKIAGIIMCQSYNAQYGTNFISMMPTNLYGQNDNFDLQSSHVLPALIRKFDDAKKSDAPSVVVWGTGTPQREFLHVDDCADAALFLMNNYDGSEIINVGTGEDVSIKELTELVRETVDYVGAVEWDTSKPDGTPRKLLDVSRLQRLGWKHSISLRDGLKQTYEWYQAQQRIRV